MVNKIKDKAKTLLQQVSMLFLQNEKLLNKQISQEKRAKKLVPILTTFILVISAKKKAARNARHSETGKNSKNGKNENKDKNLGTNFAQVLYI